MIMMEQPHIVNRLVERFLNKDKSNPLVSSTGKVLHLHSAVPLPAERPMSPFVSTNANCNDERRGSVVASPYTPRQSKPSNSTTHYLTKSQPNLRKSVNL